MPYILIRGNLASYGHKNPWRVLVSGLQAADIDQLKRFACGGFCDTSTIVYLQHPCVILTALEVLGYKVVASSSTSVKQDYNEYMWTMRKEFDEPEPTVLMEQENISNITKEALNLTNMQMKEEDLGTMEKTPVVVIPPPDTTYVYVAVRGSLHASDCSIFGLNEDETAAILEKYPKVNAHFDTCISVKANALNVVNLLSELGYRVASSCGENETTWTLQREI